MELTVIIAALLAAAAGLVVLAAFAWRWAAAHRRDLLAAGMHVADRLHMQWLPGTCQTPAWIFSTSVVLGLSPEPDHLRRYRNERRSDNDAHDDISCGDGYCHTDDDPDTG